MGQAGIFLRVVFSAMGLLLAGVLLCFSSPSNAEQQIDISRLENAADRGEVDALVGLGGLYLNGKIVPKNPEKAAQLFLKAARKGDMEAMQIVSGLYSDGRGVERNLNEAFVWMTDPPPINESGSRVNLGILWTHLRRNRNGSEEIYDGADYRVFAS
ncbi:MAG: tetratricopeptide repeat protein, partial [Pseudobdellovibrionaceae bacterium]|nr:tetratricopeptide repeat protein [Pseudobdellovibrionaceae bacterium]